ncbi:MAG: acetyl-CoA carboxylase carboxyltransferase subunit alpha [Spirochaetaceae bacterium]|nr:MAG: acetyl-CoA carboxylase carboxyltransferase subunit alpha [Spirochaetaceae bacterium]
MRLYSKCEHCGDKHFLFGVLSPERNVCPDCGYHYPMESKYRIKLVKDRYSFEEIDKDMSTCDPLDFPEYDKKIRQAQHRSKRKEAVITGRATLGGIPYMLVVMDSAFMMGSMGSVVGDKITRAFERATSERLPVVIFCASGGARMQEGIVSLMQMAKTCAAVNRHSEAGLLYISVLTHPTTGGVTASFATVADIILAEKDSLIGFAGPRVIQQTIKQNLPPGFQKSQFILEHGMADMVVDRHDIRDLLHTFFQLHRDTPKEIDHTELSAADKQWNKKHKKTDKNKAQALDAPAKTDDCADCADSANNNKHENPFAQLIKTARHAGRPQTSDYIRELISDFIQLHGDRRFGDDSALIAGVGFFHGIPVTVIGHEKGRDHDDRTRHNFGMAHPEGYRMAHRLMKQAEKFGRPIITFVDTPGAYPGIAAEERGQGEAIAANLLMMAGLKVPVISVVTGEGGSGGALGIAVANKVLMLENAIYSVISPEGCAAILWSDSSRTTEAAEALKIQAHDLLKFQVIDEIISEPAGGAHCNPAATIESVGQAIARQLSDLLKLSGPELADQRYERFRRIGDCEDIVVKNRN